MTDALAHDMMEAYDGFAEAFAKSDQLPSWRFVGRPALRSLLAGLVTSESRILDLGSASARVEAGVLLPMGAKPENIVGIELSPEQVEIARERIPKATFHVGDITDLESVLQYGQHFDITVSHMVFEHLSDLQLAQALKNAHATLKDGGSLVFVVTHPEKMTDLEGNLVTKDGPFMTTAPWGGELQNWRREVWKTAEMVTNAGFEIMVSEERAFPPPPPGLSMRDHLEHFEAYERYKKHRAIRLSMWCVKP